MNIFLKYICLKEILNYKIFPNKILQRLKKTDTKHTR